MTQIVGFLQSWIVVWLSVQQPRGGPVPSPLVASFVAALPIALVAISTLDFCMGPPRRILQTLLREGEMYRLLAVICRSGWPNFNKAVPGVLIAVSEQVNSLNAARWLRFLLLLAGDIERNPGPAKTRQPRGPLDLNVGFAPVTADRMSKCFGAFREWCISKDFDWDRLTHDPQALGWALRAYGMFCFEAGLPRYMFVYSVTGAQEYHPGCRPFLSPAWQIDKKWQIHEPGECRSVLPAIVVKAVCCLGCLWGWLNFTGLFLLGFAAMLHPSEMLALVRRDLILPSDVMYDSSSLFLKVRDPKTARFARRQHGRIDDPSIIDFVEAIFSKLPLDSRLYPASMTTFRKQWNAIMQSLGVPHKQLDSGATPGVLRGSGATFLYSTTEDVNWVAWRGRWSRVRTLEYYLQEVAAQMMIHTLSSTSKAKIEVLANASSAVLSHVCLQRRQWRADRSWLKLLMHWALTSSSSFFLQWLMDGVLAAC